GTQQAVGPGIVIEVERVGGHQAGRDPDVLDSQQQEDGPDQVQGLRGREQPSRTGTRGQPLGGKRDSIMTQEHPAKLRAGGGAVQCVESRWKGWKGQPGSKGYL